MQGDVIKAGDLEPLSDAGLLYLVTRMALRLEPWCPVGGEHDWRAAVEVLLAAANGEAPSEAVVRRLSRKLLDHGAHGAYGEAPEHEWRARNQAACVLASGLEASRLPARKDRWKEVRQAGKHAASVFAIQAHAGRLAIEDALTVPWAAVRTDIARIAEAPVPMTLAELRALAPTWPGREPAWARPVP